MSFIQRSYCPTLLDFVRSHPHFGSMREAMATGAILPCLRKDKIDFYESGARLFRFGPGNVFTHRKYIDGNGNGDRRLSKKEETQEVFERIRNTASTHRTSKATNELAAVHKLFPAFAITRGQHRPGQLALVDVEARFAVDTTRDLTARMIDLVFLMPDHRLLFVEAKCMGNPDIESIGKAAVETQVADSEKHIGHPRVLDAINRAIAAQSSLLGRPFEFATGIFPRVPILLLDPSLPQLAIGPRNAWLTDRLKQADGWTVGAERPRVIDGRRDPAAAIRDFVKKFGSSKPA